MPRGEMPVVACAVRVSCDKSAVTVLSARFAVARSEMPSPFKSPAAKKIGSSPVATVLFAVCVNVQSPFPRRMVTVLLPEFATAKSGMESPLKSPTTTKIGLTPTASVLTGAANVPSPLPSRTSKVSYA